MSLYIKYRPANLESVKGNQDIVATLEGMLADLDTCPHVFLLSGPSGCGKTTLGRIIADRLGCVGSDYREIDSADYRGIDSIREMRKNSAFSPVEGTCRVWLMDEVHKLTNDAQNAALKLLEDTPKHCYFILCTTDPQKLIAAIKGRCIELPVKPLTDTQMTGLLRGIAKREKVKVSDEILQQIVQDSLGQPRNGIQILEKVINVPEDQQLEVAKQIAAQQSQVIDLCRILLKKNVSWKEISSTLSALKDTSEPEEIRRVVMGYCQAILFKSENDRAAQILEEFIEPTYNAGFPCLTLACYRVFRN